MLVNFNYYSSGVKPESENINSFNSTKVVDVYYKNDYGFLLIIKFNLIGTLNSPTYDRLIFSFTKIKVDSWLTFSSSSVFSEFYKYLGKCSNLV